MKIHLLLDGKVACGRTNVNVQTGTPVTCRLCAHINRVRYTTRYKKYKTYRQGVRSGTRRKGQ